MRLLPFFFFPFFVFKSFFFAFFFPFFLQVFHLPHRFKHPKRTHDCFFKRFHTSIVDVLVIEKPS